MNTEPDNSRQRHSGAKAARPLRILAAIGVWMAVAAFGYFVVEWFAGEVPAALVEPEPINVHDIDIALADLDGTATRLAAWKDGPMLVNFWATWCPPCREEIPLLKTLQAEHAKDGLTIVGVAIDEMDAVREFAGSMAFNYPILVGEEDGVAMSSALGVEVLALPVSVFIGRDGVVTRVHVGEISADDASLGLSDIL